MCSMTGKCVKKSSVTLWKAIRVRDPYEGDVMYASGVLGLSRGVQKQHSKTSSAYLLPHLLRLFKLRPHFCSIGAKLH